jgi:cytidine deaminase
MENKKLPMSDESAARLVEIAVEVRQNAYARYSDYAVGAAVLTKSGEIFRGANVENAVYPLTICAERSAIFAAVSEGYQVFDSIAVVSRDGGTPCGSCRQVMAEFGLDTRVIIADAAGTIHKITTVAELLPDSFGPQNLETGG